MVEAGNRRRKEDKDKDSVRQGFRIVVFPMKRIHRVTFKAYLISDDSTSEPTTFAKRIHHLIKMGLSLNEDDDGDEAIPDLEATDEVQDSTMEEVAGTRKIGVRLLLRL